MTTKNDAGPASGHEPAGKAEPTLTPASMARGMTTLSRERANARLIHSMEELARFGDPKGKAIQIILARVRETAASASASGEDGFSLTIELAEAFPHMARLMHRREDAEAAVHSTDVGTVLDALRALGYDARVVHPPVPVLWISGTGHPVLRVSWM